MDCKGTAFFACEQVGEREIYLKLRKKCYFLRIIECLTRKIKRFTQIKHHLYLSSMSIFTHCIYAHMSVSIFTHWPLVVRVQKKKPVSLAKRTNKDLCLLYCIKRMPVNFHTVAREVYFRCTDSLSYPNLRSHLYVYLIPYSAF